MAYYQGIKKQTKIIETIMEKNSFKKKDLPFDTNLHNLKDTVEYARANFKGLVYLENL